MQPVRGGANPQVKQILDWLKTQIGQSEHALDVWQDDDMFCLKLKSGLIIHGGVVYGNIGKTVTFRQPYSNANYAVVGTAQYDSVGAKPVDISQILIYYKTTTSVMVHGYGEGEDVKVNWLAIGY